MTSHNPNGLPARQPKTDPRPAMRAQAEARGFDPELIERFLSKTEFDLDSGCLNWTAAPGDRGYGAFRFQGGVARANRVAWQLVHGPIPPKQQVRHFICNNPRCINVIDHLKLGDHQDNMDDMTRADRANSKLSNKDVATMLGLALFDNWNEDALAEEFRVKAATVDAILSGERRRNSLDYELDRDLERRSAEAKAEQQ